MTVTLSRCYYNTTRWLPCCVFIKELLPDCQTCLLRTPNRPQKFSLLSGKQACVESNCDHGAFVICLYVFSVKNDHQMSSRNKAYFT